MKKLILALIIVFSLFGCASKKKTQETKENVKENAELNTKENKSSEAEKQTAETKKENEVKTETETVVKYSPKKNELLNRIATASCPSNLKDEYKTINNCPLKDKCKCLQGVPTNGS